MRGRDSEAGSSKMRKQTIGERRRPCRGRLWIRWITRARVLRNRLLRPGHASPEAGWAANSGSPRLEPLRVSSSHRDPPEVGKWHPASFRQHRKGLSQCCPCV